MRSRFPTVTVSVLVTLAGLAPVARAATIPVTTLGDVVDAGDGCSLREAVLAVATPPGTGDCVRADANANTIALGPGKHVLTRVGPSENGGSTGDLDVDSGTVTLIVRGAGAGTTSIDATGLGDRLFDIASGAPSVAFQDLTLTGGRAPSGANGSDGVAGTAGEPGGAIRSLAALSLTDVTVTDNRAGDGGAGGMGLLTGGVAQPGAAGGAGGSGGAIQSTGSLTLTRAGFSFNFAGGGGAGGAGTTDSNGGSAGAVGGGGGFGGAIASLNGPTAVTAARFDGNQAGAGGAGGQGGFAGSNDPAAPGGTGGAGGRGGAVFAPGALAVSGSTFVANAAGPGGGGGDGGSNAFDGSAGAGAAGGIGANAGAIFSQLGDATLLNVTLVANRAGDGGAGGDGGRGGDGSIGFGMPGGAGGAGGAGGLGGGLRRQQTGTAAVTHATIRGNFAGAGGTGGAGGQGGNGFMGSGPPGVPGAPGAAGAGAGVSEAGVTNAQFTTLANSIVASNTGANCSSGVVDGGHNIAFGDSSCPFVVMDPQLGALQDNGGPVDTIAPLPGSPALDQVPPDGSGCPATDARGVPRPSPAGGMCDIGAVEISPPACQPVSATAVAGQPTPINLTCTDLAGAPFTFALLSQPAHGTLSAFDAATGRVTYTAAAAYTGSDGFAFQGTTVDGSASAPVALTVVPGPGAGGTAPLLSALAVTPRRFRAASRGGSVAAVRTGTRVSFTLDRAASVRFTVARRLVGRRVGSRCVAPTRRNRQARRCIRFVVVKGSFTRVGKAGANAFRFTGRMRKRRLALGRYVLRAKPIAAGVAGKSAKVAFRIVR